jgi:hypothetical protein
MKSPLTRRFISSEQAVATKSQHKKPCADCPFARTAIPGWLGASRNGGLATPDEWIDIAHGEIIERCHCTKNQQCAGLAIFRANVCKLPRCALLLEANRDLVFASDDEFKKHHSHFRLKGKI